MSSNTIEKGSHVLVTGAGYRVTGIARNQAKAEAVKTALVEYGSDKFKVVITGDLEKEEAFDEAVKDVDAIAHMASPLTFTSEDPIRDVIHPAVNGTVSLLHSAQKYGKNVKHIVVTSIIDAVGSRDIDHPYTCTEKDWHDGAYESKTQAERALWKFQQDESPKFTINTILPSLVIGRVIPTPKSGANMSGTPGMIAAYYAGKVDLKTEFDLRHVDVKDVALAHVRAIERGFETNGKRFILSAGTYDPQQIVDILRKHYPERKDIIPEGTPGKYKHHDKTFVGSKATKILNIQYKNLETSMIELSDSVKHAYDLYSRVC
ncbi:hypothetical protein INT44_002350 [Umbelopsis vinacea]|uniref:NAD-dependent epimerase/dehydratase domain-containing protein n=1 Tax=Umbelopsis vinacea TaxID=44442 RepID=A0A8H7UKY2_9FUNG|nr:hypothetical protein INT44_002350 [Umbelopsis vinacea]